MEHRVKADLLTRLDAGDYHQNDVTILTIPLSLPYPVHQGDYERVNGDFQYGGEYYRLVKQKLENDTLFLVCIKDKQAKKLAVALTEYTKLANDIPSGTRQALTFLSKLFKDFNPSGAIHPIANGGWQEEILPCVKNYQVVSRNYPIDSPPPEYMF
jgi:hypothetical protein